MNLPDPGTAAFQILQAMCKVDRPMQNKDIIEHLRTKLHGRTVEKAFFALRKSGLLIEDSLYKYTVAPKAKRYVNECCEEDPTPRPIVAPAYRPPFQPMTVSPFRTESPRGEPIVRRSFLTTNTAINPEYKGAA